jgi:tetratricopeptide (TPR) repeat protein
MSDRVQVCRILLRQHRYELAEREIGRMLAENPEDEAAHCLMAWCMRLTGRFKEAHEAADHAIRIAPQDSHSYYTKGNVYHDEGKFKKSLPFYRRAISLNPETVYYYFELSKALLRLGRKKEALAAAKRGLRHDPEDVDCHNARTEALKALKRNKEALKSAEKTLALDPENAQAYRLKGELHLQWEELVEADRAISQSLKLQPVNHTAQKTMGLVDEKMDEMLGEYLRDHKSFKPLHWLALACLILGAITQNGAGLMAAVLVIAAKEYWVERLKHRLENPRHWAMRKLFPWFIALGGLTLILFGIADPWYGDRVPWFFFVLFLVICTSAKEFFDDENGIKLEELAQMIGGLVFTVGLVSLSLAWVLTSLNWFWLFHLVQKIDIKKRTFDSRSRLGLQIAGGLIILWMISDLLGTWGLTHPWYGNQSLWCEEIGIFCVGMIMEGYSADEKPAEEMQAVNHNPMPSLGGSHE